MSKKIKIIDLINMQYKNEKMPKNIRIKYALNFDYYTYNEKMKWYETVDKTTILTVFRKLDYEVEILEDNTEEIENIEELYLEKVHTIPPSIFLEETLLLCEDKINELIKAVNQIRKDLNNDK